MMSRGYLDSLATQVYTLLIFKRGWRICDDLVHRLGSPKPFCFYIPKGILKITSYTLLQVDIDNFSMQV